MMRFRKHAIELLLWWNHHYMMTDVAASLWAAQLPDGCWNSGRTRRVNDKSVCSILWHTFARYEWLAPKWLTNGQSRATICPAGVSFSVHVVTWSFPLARAAGGDDDDIYVLRASHIRIIWLVGLKVVGQSWVRVVMPSFSDKFK